MTHQDKCLARAVYSDGEASCFAKLIQRTSCRHGRMVRGYRWQGEFGAYLDGLSRSHSAERMLEMARRSPRFTSITILGDAS